jgi:hypothetical protein
MHEPGTPEPADARSPKLPRRDWVLLPVLSLLTISVAVLSTEFVARRLFLFTATAPFIQNCMGPVDPAKGAWAVPNSVCQEKKYETQLVTYEFNGCGHRAGMECGAKRQPNVYRIVMVGSSYAMGYDMQWQGSLAALLPASLSRKTGRRVELYDEGMVTVFPHELTLRFDEVLAAKPDLILWVLTPLDIEKEWPPAVESADGAIEVTASGAVDAARPSDAAHRSGSARPGDAPPPIDAARSDGLLSTVWFHAKTAFTTKPVPEALADIWTRIRSRLSESASGVLLLHFLYSSQSQYIHSYLMGNDEAGFLRAHRSAEWRRRLQRFEDDAADIQGRAGAAGVPVATVLVPNRAQAALISRGDWPKDIDPYALDRDLRAIIAQHGGTYLDILPGFRRMPNAEQYYFPVDNHLNARGHAVITSLLADALTVGAVPALVRR